MVEQSKIEELASKIINENTEKETHSLLSYVDGYEYEISQDEPNRDWYIRVSPFEESNIYDGYWTGSEDKTLREAVIEAIDGAQILD